ncbi:MAG: hypothetical protein JST22_03825 [Bacteroidetes bacterium]|nr:hypothetical protein [Bacteroidota bacterium]
MRLPIRAIVLVAILALFTRPSATANMANPIHEGDAVGEPSAVLDSLHIAEEHLLIDLHQVPDSSIGTVNALYVVRNDGAGRSLELVFVAAAYGHWGAGSYRVVLDSSAVQGVTVDSAALPPQWMPPLYTPEFGAGDSLRYEAAVQDHRNFGPAVTGEPDTQRVPVFRFHITIPPGVHTIRVLYNVLLTRNGSRGPSDVWQLGYVLAPARRWSGFGTLHARVLLPPQWEAAAAPAMQRRGDTLAGEYNGVPADAISISIRPPQPSAFRLYVAESLPMHVMGVLALVLCVVSGRKLGRLGLRGGSRVVAAAAGAIGIGLLCAGGMLAAGLLEGTLLRSLFQGHLSHTYRYGDGIALVVVVVPGTFVLGVLLTSVIGAITAYRTRTRGLG